MSSVDSTSPTLEDAVALAARWHRGQSYPSVPREPFILHPLRVMLAVDSDVARIVAVLHDVLEDTACTGDDLRSAGYSDMVIAALDRLTRRDGETYETYIERLSEDALTRRDGESYETYIERLSEDALARQVKLADLADNLANNRRLADASASLDVRARITRYERALARLRAAPTAAVVEGGVELVVGQMRH